MKENEISRSCFYYEMFMERANGTYETGTPGQYAASMQNLIAAEQEKEVSLKSLARFEEQLTLIKKHMQEALNHYMGKPNVPEAVIHELTEYKNQVVWAVSSRELMEITYKTIDITSSLPIEMK